MKSGIYIVLQKLVLMLFSLLHKEVLVLSLNLFFLLVMVHGNDKEMSELLIVI